MIQQFVTTLIGLLLITNCFADDQRIQTRFESNNGVYSVQYKINEWHLTDNSGLVKYKFQDHGFTSMTMLVSDNGQNIVVIDDFMEGHTIGDKKAIWIYNNGILSQSYKLKDLINDSCNVSKSIWHTDWCIDNFGFTDSQSRFSISTYELTDYVFDLATGQIISNKKPDAFDSTALIVFGEFRKGSGEQVTMNIQKYIYGGAQKDNKITFSTKRYGVGLWREVLLIKNGRDMTPDKYRGKIFMNSCLIK